MSAVLDLLDDGCLYGISRKWEVGLREGMTGEALRYLHAFVCMTLTALQKEATLFALNFMDDAFGLELFEYAIEGCLIHITDIDKGFFEIRE